MYRPPDRSYLLPEPRAADAILDPFGSPPGGSSLSAWAAHRAAQMEAVRDGDRTVARPRRRWTRRSRRAAAAPAAPDLTTPPASAEPSPEPNTAAGWATSGRPIDEKARGV